MTNIKEKWKSKMLAILTAVILLLGVMAPVVTTVAEAATATIVFQGRIQIPGTSGDIGVGKFLVDGQRAFCMEHMVFGSRREMRHRKYIMIRISRKHYITAGQARRSGVASSLRTQV